MITVQTPDGKTATFPDGTPKEVIRDALRKKFGGGAPALTTGPEAVKAWNQQRAQAAGVDMPKTGTPPARQAEIDAATEVDMRDPGMLRSALAGATQGATFGFGDEAAAALASMSPNITYDQALANARGELDNARAARPVLTYGAEIGTGAALGGGLAGAALGTGTTVAGMAGRGALTGAVEGGLYGFGSGEGGLGNRAQNAAQSAAIGGAVGAAAPVAVAAIRGGANTVANPVMTALNIPSPTKAARAVQTYVNRSGLTPQQLDDALKAAAREGQPEFMLADALGNPGQRGLAGVARTPGDARRGIVDQLMQRQDGQAGRLARFVDEGLNDPQNVGRTAAQVQDGLVSARGTAANAAYDAARAGAGPVDVRGALDVINARIGPMQGSGVAGDGIDGALAGFKARLAAPQSALPSGTTARELSDFDRVLGVKQDVEDAIGAALRAGRNNEARELGKLKSALDGALEASSDGYRAANDGFATASRAIDQIDAGSAATGPRVRAADTVQAYTGMPADQQSAFRAGYADPLLARIEKDAPGVNKARPLRSEKATAELGAMANDPALLGRRIERENTMFETGAQALGGSRTADNLADMAETEALSAPLIANVLSGRWGAAATQAGQGVLNAATGNSEATRALIAKALMGNDVLAALKPAQIAALKAGKASQVVEALMRAGALRAFGQ
jgi:hypothetical protein